MVGRLLAYRNIKPGAILGVNGIGEIMRNGGGSFLRIIEHSVIRKQTRNYPKRNSQPRLKLLSPALGELCGNPDNNSTRPETFVVF
jgi:hypothetical protein